MMTSLLSFMVNSVLVNKARFCELSFVLVHVTPFVSFSTVYNIIWCNSLNNVNRNET